MLINIRALSVASVVLASVSLGGCASLSVNDKAPRSLVHGVKSVTLTADVRKILARNLETRATVRVNRDGQEVSAEVSEVQPSVSGVGTKSITVTPSSKFYHGDNVEVTWELAYEAMGYGAQELSVDRVYKTTSVITVELTPEIGPVGSTFRAVATTEFPYDKNLPVTWKIINGRCSTIGVLSNNLSHLAANTLTTSPQTLANVQYHDCAKTCGVMYTPTSTSGGGSSSNKASGDLVVEATVIIDGDVITDQAGFRVNCRK